jgi:hypothetical protein
MPAPLALAQRNPFGGVMDSLADWTPKLLAFVVILAVGWGLGYALRRLVRGMLDRSGFPHAVARGGLAPAERAIDPSLIVAKIVHWSVLLVAVAMAFSVFGRNPIGELLASVVAFLPQLAIAAAILLVAAVIARAVRDLITGMLGGLSYAPLLASLAAAFIGGLGIIAALDQIGVATSVTTPVLVTVLATMGGILVVGVGGGLIRPMQRRWELWLDVAERESRNIKHTIHYNADASPQSPAAGFGDGSGPDADTEPAGPVTGTGTGWSEDDTPTLQLPVIRG